MAIDKVDPEYDGDIHKEAMMSFDRNFSYQQEERAQALQDRRFVFISGAQWEGNWGELFANSIMVEINKCAQGYNDIINAYADHRMGVNFRSVNQSTKDDAASTLNGMYLADYYLSNGDQAVDNAFSEGVAGGYGAFELCNVYCDDEDEDDNKQKIIWETIVDADQTVYWDPNSKLYDKSDAEYCFVIVPMSLDAFSKEYGEDAIASWPEKFIKSYYDWYQPSIVRIAKYYKLVKCKDTVYKYVNEFTGLDTKVYKSDDDYAEKVADLKKTGYSLSYKKDITKTECRKWIMSGMEVLEGGEEGNLIAGGVIPVIPYYGQRYFIDNVERAKGHVRNAKDPNRVYNSQISKLVELAALSPREIPIVTTEQIEGHEQEWADQNINRSPYATINTVIDETTGQKLLSGPVGKIEPPNLPPVLSSLIQITNSDIMELTNSNDGAGEVKANVSADAMDIAATRTDAKADLYINNMARTLIRCGQVYQAMAKDIYFEDDREVPIAKYDQDQKLEYSTTKINSRSVDASKNQIIANQISKGEYHVIADVSEQTKTKRDKTVKSLYNMLQFVMPVDPELGKAISGTMILNMDGDGIEDLQGYIRQKLLLEGVVQPNDNEQQQLDQMKQAEAAKGPSPTDQVLMAEAAQLQANAEKAKAQTHESATKSVVNLANADKIKAETGSTHINTFKEIHSPLEGKGEQNQSPATNSTKKSWLSRFLNRG